MLFEVLLRQSYFGRNIINRWHYLSQGVPAAVQLSFALTEAFGGIPAPVTNELVAGSIMQLLSSIQSSSLAYNELTVEAMYDVTDFYSVPFPPPVIGTAPGTAMSPFCAYALQSNRLRTDIRRGNKRLCGVSETFVNAGGLLDSGITIPLEVLAAAMSDPLEYDDEGNAITFTPVVLSFKPASPQVDPPRYAKYPTLAEQLAHASVGVTWTPKAYMTTQNTRK
jgi:hypothetical protein